MMIFLFHESPNFSLHQSLLLPFVVGMNFHILAYQQKRDCVVVGFFPEFFYGEASIQLFCMDMMKMEVRLYQINFFLLNFIANTDFLLLTETTNFASYYFFAVINSFLYFASIHPKRWRKNCWKKEEKFFLCFLLL